MPIPTKGHVHDTGPISSFVYVSALVNNELELANLVKFVLVPINSQLFGFANVERVTQSEHAALQGLLVIASYEAP